MTATQRQTLRQLIDQAVRAKLDSYPRPTVCRNCKCDMDAFTRGCLTCARRHHRRAHQARA